MNAIQQRYEDSQYTRIALTRDVNSLSQEMQRYVQLGHTDEANRIARRISEYSEILNSDLLRPDLPVCADPKTNSRHWLGGVKLLCSTREGTDTDVRQFAKSGDSLYNQGNWARALEQYKKCLVIEERLMPGSSSIFYTYKNIGEVYQAQGRLEEAFIAFHQAFKCNPDSADASIPRLKAILEELGVPLPEI